MSVQNTKGAFSPILQLDTALPSEQERPVTYAVMHHPMHAPGIGNVKETLTDSPSAMFQSTKITLEKGGVLVRLEFKDKGGKILTALVPASNFKILVLK